MSTFDLRQAMRNLDITVKPFGYGDMRITPGLRGYSTDRWLAINPDERWPEMVTFHEMAHILRGDTTYTGELKKIVKKPFHSRQEMAMLDAFLDEKERNYDIVETECHVTGIFTCQITGTSFDLDHELEHLAGYTQGRIIPPPVLNNARKTAVKIAHAGAADKHSWLDKLVAACLI